MAQLSDAARDLPVSALNALVSDAVDLVVHTERGPDGPRVSSILAVEDLAAGPEAVQFTTTDVFTREQHQGELEWTGLVPMRVAQRMGRSGRDARAILECRATPVGAAAPPSGNAPW